MKLFLGTYVCHPRGMISLAGKVTTGLVESDDSLWPVYD